MPPLSTVPKPSKRVLLEKVTPPSTNSAASALAGDLPQVLQPNATTYSASEVAALTQAMTTLTEVLNDYDMASRRYFSPTDWGSRDFAMYTAGVLSEKAYDTVLVSSDGWPDGVHTWLLVEISLGTKTAWVPVEAFPEAGHNQQILGTIPSTTDASGNVSFDPRYTAFTSAEELPANTAPVAVIRNPVFATTTDEPATLLAFGSVDKDGDIVLYQWDFGDGNKKTTLSWSAHHSFSGEGHYTVTLTVVDNLGKQDTTSLDLGSVGATEEDSSAGGCGCGS